jgi:hypothetical protein
MMFSRKKWHFKRNKARCQWLPLVIIATLEHLSSKPNSSQDPVSKIPNTKGLMEWLKV